MVSKVWIWYKRHSNAVDAILDMACAAVPGACFVKGTLKLALAQLQDSKDAEQEDKVQEMEKVLEEVQPVIRDVVEEIEELESFQKATKEEEKKKAIEESPRVNEEVEKILPAVVQSLVHSMPEIGKTRILNRKYELLEEIARGGQGIVYRGRHLKAQTAVAIKLLSKELSQDNTAIEGLRLEFQHLVQNLRHPNIVQYWDMDEDEESGQYYLVMDLVEGKNLRRIIMAQRKKPMAKEEVGKWLLPVAMALDFAHENKIVHRDVKPENILIRDKDGKVFLTDFGLSAEIHSSFSCKGKMTENISGTMPYMAPEQYKGRPAAAETDNWALGVMAYEMLAGYHPFQGMSFEHYKGLICDEPLAEADGMPPETWRTLQKMLEKEKKDRPGNAQSWVKELVDGSPRFVEPKPPAQAKASESHDRPPAAKPKPEAPAKPSEIYGLPLSVWNQSKYNHKGEEILDMASDFWCKLSVAEQIKYASLYQKGYAASKNLEVEKTIEYSEDKVHTILVPARTSFVMRLVPPGRFWMGSPENEPLRCSDDEKRHRVVITRPYFMGKYEITQGQWKAVMGNNPSNFQKAGLQAPVERVSWNDCQDFCGKVKMQLPTEAQWEYACRGGVTRAYYYGEDAGSLGEYAWWGDNSSGTTHPVGEKRPNAWDLYDMVGNVWEWCKDYKNDYPTNDIVDPECQNGVYRVCRGGSWISNGVWGLRSAFRSRGDASDAYDVLGARFVLLLSGSF